MLLITRVKEVRQRRRIAWYSGKGRRAKRSERLHRHHPRRQGCRKTLCQKRPQWLILPRLNIARRPVIEQADSKNMFLCLPDGNAPSEPVSTAHKESTFQFVVKLLSRI